VEQLKASFAHYDANDIARALSTTMHLYRWLEDETAAKWGYSLPLEGEKQAAHATYLLLKEYGVKNTLEMNSPEATV
jgi:site-specific recombinase XerD